jgi:hypothetical protein
VHQIIEADSMADSVDFRGVAYDAFVSSRLIYRTLENDKDDLGFYHWSIVNDPVVQAALSIDTFQPHPASYATNIRLALNKKEFLVL